MKITVLAGWHVKNFNKVRLKGAENHWDLRHTGKPQ